MKKRSLLKKILITGLIAANVGLAIGLYLYNMPHRNVQSAKADYSLTSSQIVAEYLDNKENANRKYLTANCNSKILEITGSVRKISEDYNGQKVVLIMNRGDKAGVRASFTFETNMQVSDIETDQEITIKGVIQSGASYDEDLELYEHVILEKSAIARLND